MSETSKLIRDDMVHTRMSVEAEERERRSSLPASAGSSMNTYRIKYENLEGNVHTEELDASTMESAIHFWRSMMSEEFDRLISVVEVVSVSAV